MDILTWRQGGTQYVEQYGPLYLRPATVRRIQFVLAAFARYLLRQRGREDLPLAEISPELVEGFLGHRRLEGASAATANAELRHLRAIFRWLVLKRKLRSDPSHGIRSLPAESIRRRAQDVTADQARRVLVHLRQQRRPRLADLVELVVETGLRHDEALELWPWNFREADRVLEITVHGDGWQPKRGREREIPLNDRAFEILKRRVEEVGRSSRIFASLTGRRLSARNTLRDLQRAGKAVGVPHVTFQGLRALAGTRWAATMMPFQLAAILGHSSVKTTERFYVRRRAMELPVPPAL